MMVIGDLPRRNAWRYPGEIALVAGARRVTWRDLNDRVNALAHGLAARGLRKGDRIAILSTATIEVIETYLAAAKLGLVIVPIHTGLVEREVEFMLSDVGARAVVVEAQFCAQFAATIAAVRSIDLRVAIGDWAGFTSIAALAAEAAEEPPRVTVDTDLFAIRFTSGTTGLPKGCPSTHRDWLRRSMNFMAHVNHSHHDRALMLAPLSLGVGSSMLMSYALVGARMVLMPRFDAAEALRAIEREKITTFMIPVPTLFARFLDAPEMATADISSLRVVGYGGAIFPLPLLRRTLERFRCDFFGVYGHLEAGGFSTYLLPEDHRLEGLSASALDLKLKRLGSCGREALQADVRVMDEDGRFVDAGEIGELVVRTEGMITDYWNRPGEIEKSIRDGWFHTGDGATLDADGFIYISDRLKDVIRSGGMNVSAFEVEAIIGEVEGVAESAVIGVSDPRWGEIVVACVVRKAGASVAEDVIIDHCREKLANYKVPKRVAFFDELPKNSMGKVLKRELKQMAPA